MKSKPVYHVVAVNHLDLGFVKRKEEMAELLEIWVERMISVMERFPDLKFAIEQAYHYRGLEERRPDLMEKLKTYIAQGRVEMMGGMISSMDTNFTNGESFVRNQSLGLRWVKEHLGTTPKAAWLLDTFGINAQIPQLLKQYGFRYLFANRFGGKNPYDLFLSQGIDGSEIIVLGRDLACQQIFPYSQAFVFCKGFNDTESLFENADHLQGNIPRLVVFYLENEEVLSTYYRDLTLKRQKRQGEEWKFSSYGEYLDALDQEDLKLELIPGDLNPEFTGTFALRTPIKMWNRKAETALLEAEEWDALLSLGISQKLENCWWDLGYVQFHDVFTGSHEDCTYLDVISKLKNVVSVARQAVNSAFPIKRSPQGVVCLNPLPFARKEWVEIPGKAGQSMQVQMEGRQLPVAYVDGRVFCQVDLPPASATNLSVQPGSLLEHMTKKIGIPCETCTLKNPWVTLSLHRQKGILSLKAGELLMERVKDFLTVQHDMGSLQIEEILGEELSVMDGNSCLYFREDQIGQTAVFCGSFQDMPWNHRQNQLNWQVEFILPRDKAIVAIKVNLDWKGEATRIRLRLPHLVDSSQAIYEIPFGIVQRSAYDGHSTAKGEWPTHRFVAVEDSRRGFALANQGVAGVELAGNAFETTLLRAYPDYPGVWVPVTPLSSQHGKHSYSFLVIPYNPGDVSHVAQTAQCWNQPVQVFSGSCEESWAGRTLLSISEPNLILSTVKVASDGTGDLIVRYYETAGQETEAQIFVLRAKEVWLSDVTEREISQMDCRNGKIKVRCCPFEIQTLRIHQ